LQVEGVVPEQLVGRRRAYRSRVAPVQRLLRRWRSRPCCARLVRCGGARRQARLYRRGCGGSDDPAARGAGVHQPGAAVRHLMVLERQAQRGESQQLGAGSAAARSGVR
jgi:hypothetical protein